jgi:DNA-binding response OmpR family regulator
MPLSPRLCVLSSSSAVVGTERILLVEDDSVVRALAHEILVADGYDVIAAADGEEALSFARDHRFDLLITDIVMPKLSGKELARLLISAQPGLCVVYMSGYAHDAAGDRLTAGDAFIQKPFPAPDLCATVRAKNSNRAKRRSRRSPEHRPSEAKGPTLEQRCRPATGSRSVHRSSARRASLEAHRKSDMWHVRQAHLLCI